MVLLLFDMRPIIYNFLYVLEVWVQKIHGGWCASWNPFWLTNQITTLSIITTPLIFTFFYNLNDIDKVHLQKLSMTNDLFCTNNSRTGNFWKNTTNLRTYKIYQNHWAFNNTIFSKCAIYIFVCVKTNIYGSNPHT